MEHFFVIKIQNLLSLSKMNQDKVDEMNPQSILQFRCALITMVKNNIYI